MRALVTLSGLVIHGDGRGKGLGFPTANLACEDEALPEDGIYVARARVDGEATAWCATVSVGANPTFGGIRARRVEVHLHDADIDLYGRMLIVEIFEFLRPTLQFRDIEHLVRQAEDDVRRCRERIEQLGLDHSVTTAS